MSLCVSSLHLTYCYVSVCLSVCRCVSRYIYLGICLPHFPFPFYLLPSSAHTSARMSRAHQLWGTTVKESCARPSRSEQRDACEVALGSACMSRSGPVWPHQQPNTDSMQHARPLSYPNPPPCSLPHHSRRGLPNLDSRGDQEEEGQANQGLAVAALLVLRKGAREPRLIPLWPQVLFALLGIIVGHGTLVPLLRPAAAASTGSHGASSPVHAGARRSSTAGGTHRQRPPWRRDSLRGGTLSGGRGQRWGVSGGCPPRIP